MGGDGLRVWGGAVNRGSMEGVGGDKIRQEKKKEGGKEKRRRRNSCCRTNGRMDPLKAVQDVLAYLKKAVDNRV